MGGGRDKRKKAKERKEGLLPGVGLHKTEKKTEKNELKKERRAAKALAGDEDNIEALLLKVGLQDKEVTSVVMQNDAPPPSPRVNASFVVHVAPKVSEVLMFGGECIDPISSKVMTFNELYRYHTDKGKWTKVTAPNTPAPRCAHQAVVYKNAMYIFGGEITSPNQERFHHYKELWRLDLTTWEWDQLPQKGTGCPSARSGHRMVVHKGRVVMFGGFFDTGKEVRYFNEGWVFNFEQLKWSGPYVPAPGQPWPSARSGCQVALHGDTLFVYGGYSKVADDDDKEIEHGKVCDDMWTLDLNKLTWERVKKVGMAPGPRSSFAMMTHKNRALLFGGVSDNETKGGEDLSSDFHNDLYQFNMETRRWYAAEMRPPKKGAEGAKGAEGTGAETEAGAEVGTSSAGGGAPAKAIGATGRAGAAAAAAISPTVSRSAPGATLADAGTAGPGPSSLDARLTSLLESGRDKNSAIYKAVVKIQSQFRGYVVRKAYKTYRLGGEISELLYSPAAYGLDMSVRNMPKPRGRINAQVAVVGNIAYLFGGIVEIGDQEITLDDMWMLDLAKMDGWQLLKENTGGEEVFRRAAAAGESSDYEEGSSSDSSR